MDIDKRITCDNCKHHEKPSCKRIKYNDFHYPIGTIKFRTPICASTPTGAICSEFELRDFYYNSTDYYKFTLENYMVHKGIELLEHRILSATGFHTRKTCDGYYMFEFIRDKEEKGYKIYFKGSPEQYFHNFHTWVVEGAFDVWLDICRSSRWTPEYIDEAKEEFLKGYVSLVVDGYDGWFLMPYKDFFFGKFYRDDGKLNVVEHHYFKVRGGGLPYELRKERVGGLIISS